MPRVLKRTIPRATIGKTLVLSRDRMGVDEWASRIVGIVIKRSVPLIAILSIAKTAYLSNSSSAKVAYLFRIFSVSHS